MSYFVSGPITPTSKQIPTDTPSYSFTGMHINHSTSQLFWQGDNTCVISTPLYSFFFSSLDPHASFSSIIHFLYTYYTVSISLTSLIFMCEHFPTLLFNMQDRTYACPFSTHATKFILHSITLLSLLSQEDSTYTSHFILHSFLSYSVKHTHYFLNDHKATNIMTHTSQIVFHSLK